MNTFWKLGATLLLCSNLAHASTIISGGTVIANTLGEHSWGESPVADMLNQSGLSANYVSGVTDFGSFTSSGVTHDGGDAESWLGTFGVFSGSLIFDLGSTYNLSRFVMWNGADGISASVSSFTLTTSLTSDFSTSTFAGLFFGQQSDYSANVYDLIDSVARYVRLDIHGNFGNTCCTAIGDLAFEGSPPVAVPEPGSLALLGLGMAGLAGLRRRQRD